MTYTNYRFKNNLIAKHLWNKRDTEEKFYDVDVDSMKEGLKGNNIIILGDFDDMQLEYIRTHIQAIKPIEIMTKLASVLDADMENISLGAISRNSNVVEMTATEYFNYFSFFARDTASKSSPKYPTAFRKICTPHYMKILAPLSLTSQYSNLAYVIACRTLEVKQGFEAIDFRRLQLSQDIYETACQELNMSVDKNYVCTPHRITLAYLTSVGFSKTQLTKLKRSLTTMRASVGYYIHKDTNKNFIEKFNNTNLEGIKLSVEKLIQLGIWE